MDSEIETPFLHLDTVNGAVDYRGQPVLRSKSGYWRSAWFTISVEVGERMAFFGIESNLITFLTGALRQSTAAAAGNVNMWQGTASLLPLLGAFVADSYLGRYRTIIVASLVYILGLGLLTLSAMLPSLLNSECEDASKYASCSTKLQLILFFLALYLMALGQGGHKPCVQAFAADQFDEQHPKESKERSSFLTGGILLCVQASWFHIEGHEKSPFVRIGRVFVAALRNWGINPSKIAFKEEARNITPHQTSKQFSFLDKALFVPIGSKEEEACSLREVEEAKAVLRLFPIWAASLVFGIIYAQMATLFTKQGITMDRTIFPGFDIPPASLQTFIPLGIVVFTLIYDRIFVPVARIFSKKPLGITMLQRIGTGIFLSIITVVIAALVEMRRLQTAIDYGLVDDPNATIPMSVWWLIPQYFLFGVADVFTVVGFQEFFYDQVPKELRSMGLALYSSILGVGSLLSSIIVYVIEELTGKDGQSSWFNDNLNQAHLDYFYWLLAGLTLMGLALFIFSAKSYIYNKEGVAQG
ncbi:hypothetical protein K1719_023945 [Acacia pycnantha]|nr:hypothetical protein K1719_023945 [Acacia pycnantha]